MDEIDTATGDTGGSDGDAGNEFDPVGRGGVIRSRYRISDAGDDLQLGGRLTILEALRHELEAPFPPEYIEIKPGPVSTTSDSALALFYADPRTYWDRLDLVLGKGNWRAEFHPFTANDISGLLCTLYVYGEPASQASADFQHSDGDNIVTSAEAQCFKRACAAIGIGRYLWQMEELWADYDKQRRKFKNVRATVLEAYRRSGLV